MPRHFVFRINYLITAYAGYLLTNFSVQPVTSRKWNWSQLNWESIELWQSIKNVKFKRTTNKKKLFTLKELKPFEFVVSTLLLRKLFLAPTWMNSRVIFMQIQEKAAARPSQDNRLLIAWDYALTYHIAWIALHMLRIEHTRPQRSSIKNNDVSAGQLNFRMTRIGVTSHHYTNISAFDWHCIHPLNESHKFTWRSKPYNLFNYANEVRHTGATYSERSDFFLWSSNRCLCHTLTFAALFTFRSLCALCMIDDRCLAH